MEGEYVEVKFEPDTRTSAEKTLDEMLDLAGINEMGADPLWVYRSVALSLILKIERLENKDGQGK